MTRIRIITVCFVTAIASSAVAKDWLQLEGLGDLTRRVTITVENPGDVDMDSALVHIPLSELSSKLPDAKDGQIAIADPTTKEPKRDAADLFFVSSQVN